MFPNLVILTPDQYRADYLSCYGHPTINTRHIDRLADEGVRFEHCYCAAPLCGPSRISFATSLRLSEHRRRNYGSCIDFNVPNLVGTLKQHGYRTGMFGKNHLFLYDQLEQAWDEMDEICLGNYDDHPAYTRAWSAFPLEASHPYNISARLADEAIRFIQDSPANQPFLCWVNWQDPHPAFTCPQPYATLFSPEDVRLPVSWTYQTEAKPHRLENWRANTHGMECAPEEARRAIAMYMGQCRYVDDQVGRIYDCLEKNGQLDRTLILFFSDHGELLGDFGVFHKLPVFYESLTRIPVILRYPAKAHKKQVVNGLVEAVDLAPTLLEALGLPVPQTMVGRAWHTEINLDQPVGRESILVEAGLQIPTAETPRTGMPQRAPFPPNSYGPGAMVSDGRYKLSMYYDDQHELYDLQADPAEMSNLYNDPALAEVQARLTVLLVQRLLGAGVRPEGEWLDPGVDPRDNPPEGRMSNSPATGKIFKSQP